MLLVYSLFFIVYKFIEEDYIIRKENLKLNIKSTNNIVKKTFFYGFNLNAVKLWIKNNIYNNKVFNKQYIKSLLLMTGLFVFMTYPLILRFSSAIPGNGGSTRLED